MNVSRLQVIVGTVGIIILLACSSQSALGERLVGNGEWQSDRNSDYVKGRWVANFERDGTRLSGTFTLTGSNVLHGGSVEGTVDAQNVVLGLSADGANTATFSGKIDGDSIYGQWDCPLTKDQGFWFGTLVGAGNAP